MEIDRIVILGGGISGLATAFRIEHAFASQGLAPEIVVLEADSRPGGKIRTDKTQGYLCEWGPNGFLDNRPSTLELCRDLSVEDRLLPSNDAARKRFIVSKGRLHQVPESPAAFFRSNLLTIRGRLRIVGEYWARATPHGVDTSIYEFGTRRLGKEATEKLLDPMVSGIFAGDPQVMSLEACFPRIAQMEREHGSLIRAMMRLAKQRRQKGVTDDSSGPGEGERTGEEAPLARSALSSRSRPRSGPAGPGGILISFTDGLETIVARLAERLGRAVRTGCAALSVEDMRGRGRSAATYRIHYREAGREAFMDADAVVIALPAYAAKEVVRPLEPEVSALLGEIPYAPLVVVGLGFRVSDLPQPPDGFGFLVPHQERRSILGSLWCSSIFPGRAPEGHVLTRSMVGGYRAGQALDLDDQELVRTVLDEYQALMGWRASPVYVNIIRHPQAIPLYTIGHLKRLERIEQVLGRHTGVYLTGNALRGVALNDCTREALAVARRVVQDATGSRTL